MADAAAIAAAVQQGVSAAMGNATPRGGDGWQNQGYQGKGGSYVGYTAGYGAAGNNYAANGGGGGNYTPRPIEWAPDGRQKCLKETSFMGCPFGARCIYAHMGGTPNVINPLPPGAPPDPRAVGKGGGAAAKGSGKGPGTAGAGFYTGQQGEEVLGAVPLPAEAEEAKAEPAKPTLNEFLKGKVVDVARLEKAKKGVRGTVVDTPQIWQRLVKVTDYQVAAVDREHRDLHQRLNDLLHRKAKDSGTELGSENSQTLLLHYINQLESAGLTPPDVELTFSETVEADLEKPAAPKNPTEEASAPLSKLLLSTINGLGEKLVESHKALAQSMESKLLKLEVENQKKVEALVRPPATGIQGLVTPGVAGVLGRPTTQPPTSGIASRLPVTGTSGAAGMIISPSGRIRKKSRGSEGGLPSCSDGAMLVDPAKQNLAASFGLGTAVATAGPGLSAESAIAGGRLSAAVFQIDGGLSTDEDLAVEEQQRAVVEEKLKRETAMRQMAAQAKLSKEIQEQQQMMAHLKAQEEALKASERAKRDAKKKEVLEFQKRQRAEALEIRRQQQQLLLAEAKREEDSRKDPESKWKEQEEAAAKLAARREVLENEYRQQQQVIQQARADQQKLEHLHRIQSAALASQEHPTPTPDVILQGHRQLYGCSCATPEQAGACPILQAQQQHQQQQPLDLGAELAAHRADYGCSCVNSQAALSCGQYHENVRQLGRQEEELKQQEARNNLLEKLREHNRRFGCSCRDAEEAKQCEDFHLFAPGANETDEEKSRRIALEQDSLKLAMMQHKQLFNCECSSRAEAEACAATKTKEAEEAQTRARLEQERFLAAGSLLGGGTGGAGAEGCLVGGALAVGVTGTCGMTCPTHPESKCSFIRKHGGFCECGDCGQIVGQPSKIPPPKEAVSVEEREVAEKLEVLRVLATEEKAYNTSTPRKGEDTIKFYHGQPLAGLDGMLIGKATPRPHSEYPVLSGNNFEEWACSFSVPVLDRARSKIPQLNDAWRQNEKAGSKFEAAIRTWGFKWEGKYQRNAMLAFLAVQMSDRDRTEGPQNPYSIQGGGIIQPRMDAMMTGTASLLGAAGPGGQVRGSASLAKGGAAVGAAVVASAAAGGMASILASGGAAVVTPERRAGKQEGLLTSRDEDTEPFNADEEEEEEEVDSEADGAEVKEEPQSALAPRAVRRRGG